MQNPGPGPPTASLSDWLPYLTGSPRGNWDFRAGPRLSLIPNLGPLTWPST